MAFTVRPDGSISVDSLDEAVALSKRLAGGKPTNTKSSDQSPPRNVVAPNEAHPRPERHPAQTTLPVTRALQTSIPQGWSAFISLLPENQKRFLAFVRKHRRVQVDQIRIVLGLKSSKGVPGVLSGIVHNAQRTGIPVENVLRREKVGPAADPDVYYVAGPSLISAADSDLPDPEEGD